ncbi:Transposon Tf2-6 polyprotein [Nosema granulosis]|uniref:Transposon Tf2-6 polyprotein n=1 Tax=Nosema granulosis TaxID=83296 RepID=A0A9P6KX47_9MICR|nr:Transposon Tf2-6 polyprotein [Nosema granulosis]
MNNKTPDTRNYHISETRPSYTKNQFVNKKKIYTKSILETYFNLGYVILSSNDKQSENLKERREEEEKNQRTCKFKLVIEGLEEELYQEIKVIDDIRHLDIIRWCKGFDDLVSLNKWPKNIQAAVLRQLIKDERIVKHGIKDNWKDVREQLIKHVYPPEEERLYKKKLQNIQQINYQTIQEYYDELKKNIDILRIITKMKEGEIQSLFSESFYNGLGRYTYGRVIEFDFAKFEDCFEYLLALETKVKVRSKEMKENQGHTINKRYTPHPTKNNNEQNNVQKYCKLHRYGNHTTEECYKYDKDFYKKKDNKQITNEQNYLIKERVNNPTKTALIGTINEQNIELRIDCGASRSFIRSDTVKKLKLELIEAEKITTIFGNGHTENTNHVVELEILLKDHNITLFEKLYVLEKLPENILLGNDFLFNNEIVLDYKNRVIFVKNQPIDMLGRDEIHPEEMDRILYERVLCIEEESKLNSKVQEKLTEYIRKNEKLMKIKIAPIKLFIDEEIKKQTLVPQYYSVPLKYVKGAKAEIQRLLEADIIEEHRAPFASPSFLIEKKNKELRLVVDYRKINAYIKDEISTIPKIFESLYKIGTNKIFSKIDLKNGFNQLELDKESRDITSFTMLGQQYRYKRVPFGIKSGPKLFQRTINIILSGIENCSVYIDDIIIYGKDETEHNETLLKVLDRLGKYNVKINFDKSKFLTRKIEILGNVIENGTIKIDTESIDKLLNSNFKKESKKDIQKIIGTITWYRNFIPDVSRKILSLTRLLRNDTMEKWGEEQERALNNIKEEIKTKAQLSLPDFNKKFRLQCDASEEGMGAVLFQDHGVISYYSKKFNSIEKNYTIVEKEMFAMLKALQFYRTLIQGYAIEIETDSRNCIFENKTISKRTERWKLMFNEFDLTIKNIKGTDNNIADKLSRCFLINEKETTNFFKQIEKMLKIENMVCVKDKSDKYVVREDKRHAFIKKVHEFSIHAGITTMYYNIKDIYYVKNIKEIIEEVVKTCEKCLRCKKLSKTRTQKFRITSSKLMDTICSDIFGPFEMEEYDRSSRCYNEKGYLLTITDVYSRYTEVFNLRNVTAKELILQFQSWFKRHRKPRIIICDNGKQYTSKEFDEFLKINEVRKIATPMYHPASNGISERLNQSIAEVLRMNKNVDIKEILKLIMKRLNGNYHRGIREQPNAIVKGFSDYARFKEVKRHVPLLVQRMKDIRISKQRINKTSEIKIGDLILIRNFNGKKLDDMFVGPFKVEQVGVRGLWYKIEGKAEWLHWDDIKLFKQNLKIDY